MVNFHIAFDNDDISLGHYFEQSKIDVIAFINAQCPDKSITEISSLRCNQAYIDFSIAQVNMNNFLFLAYSHGNEDSLVANGSFYVKKTVNSSLFLNSLFYSMSCLTGKELGDDLIRNGGHAFIGFKDIAYALPGAFQQLSIECDNHAIKSFIQGITIGDSFQEMINNFTQKIDYLESIGEPLFASFLIVNRDSMFFAGNPALAINQFNN